MGRLFTCFGLKHGQGLQTAQKRQGLPGAKRPSGGEWLSRIEVGQEGEWAEVGVEVGGVNRSGWDCGEWAKAGGGGLKSRNVLACGRCIVFRSFGLTPPTFLRQISERIMPYWSAQLTSRFTRVCIVTKARRSYTLLCCFLIALHCLRVKLVNTRGIYDFTWCVTRLYMCNII